MKFTKLQLENWRIYESVRKEGAFNMFDSRARELTGLEKEDYYFIVKNYSELKEAQPK